MRRFFVFLILFVFQASAYGSPCFCENETIKKDMHSCCKAKSNPQDDKFNSHHCPNNKFTKIIVEENEIRFSSYEKELPTWLVADFGQFIFYREFFSTDFVIRGPPDRSTLIVSPPVHILFEKMLC